MSGISYIMVVIGILTAKCLGFLREIVFASVFGASEYTDIYFQIFSIASLVFTGVGTALATLVIKNLNKSENSTPEMKRGYVAYFIRKTSIIVIAITAALYVSAPLCIKILLPGLNKNLYDTALKVMYIMLPSALFIIAAYIMSGVLQNCKVFFVTSIMSLPYNIVIIAFLLFKTTNIFTISLITTFGWFLHIVILMPQFIKKGYRLSAKAENRSIKSDNGREVLFIFISSMMFQICFITDKASVSADSGSASTINYASNLFLTIASVFVVAMSNVTYPSICKNFENGNMKYVTETLKYLITVLFAIFLPFILVVCFFGGDIISLVYERGEFTHELAVKTSVLFAVYTFGIFGYVCQEILNKILYLGSKYKYTVSGTLVVILLKPVINRFLFPVWGAVGVACATTLLFTLYAIFIAVLMKKVVGKYTDRRLARNILKTIISGAAASGAYFAVKMSGLAFLQSRLGFIANLAVCAVVYLAFMLLLGMRKEIMSNQK